MADLQFNIKASFDEVAKARQELQRLREELKNTTRATDLAKRQDLTERYNEQASKVRDLTAAIQRYSFVMSKDFAKNMQSLTREVYSFELQADASQRKINKLSSDIAKMQAKLRKGGLDVGTESVLNTNINESSKALTEEKKRYESLVGLGKEARKELQNMQDEYVRYSGSSTAATDNVKIMTDAFANMITEMKKVPTVGEGATSLFNRLGGDAKQLAMSLVGGLGFEQLAEHIFNVRSQFQQLEISFNTMLGSEQKAGALMSQLIDTAKITPFNMSSITEGAKQLLAYGIQANEVNETLIHLGDIASGLNIPLGQLVYLYGTTIAQGRMYTMDLRQFMGRGVPMAEELGKIMGKTTQEVQQAITDGKVGADLVKEAIYNMSAEGGKFGGLMEKQSLTLQGRWSNIEDSVDQMFNEMGKKSEGVFGYGLDQIAALVDNWETVIKVIGTAAVAVGTYKASLMAAASIQKAQNSATLDAITANLNAQIEHYKSLSKGYRESTGKNTGEYKEQRVQELNSVVGDTHMIGNKQTEELVALKIKQAQTDGIITEQMAEQLQLKRDMLVAQQQSTANDAAEAAALSKGLDEKMSQFKEMENDYRKLNGKDTKDYKANRYNELSDVLSDTENIGDEGTEKMVSDQIKLAQAEGLISEETAKQLQLKRDLLVEQSNIAAKEQLQYQNAVRAKEEAAEELRLKKEEEAEIAKINASAVQKEAEEELTKKIAEANKTKYGQALLETHELEKQVELLEESKNSAYDDAKQKKQAVDELDTQIKKQQELIDMKEKDIVENNSMGDTTSFGGYDDGFSQYENTAVEEYEAEKAKLDELMLKRQQANDEFEQAHEKARSINQERIDMEDKLAAAYENELDIYKDTGAEADEIQEVVEKGIAIKEGDMTITEAATAAKQANTSSENANTVSRDSNTGATARQTTANVTNTTSTATNTTATNNNTTSENTNTGAKERNALATSILSVGNKGLAMAQNVLTWATNSVTASLKGLWAAMLANPITTVVTLVTTAISIFSMFGDEEEDAAKKTEDMGNKAAEASNKVRSLFSVLSTGKAEDHKDTINELKAAYEEYGIQLNETKMKSKDMGEQLDELKSHEEELIGMIEKRSVEMERANQLQQAYDDYNTANDSSYDTFKKDVGGNLSDVEKGQIRSLVSQDDIDKLAQLSAGMKECGGDLKVYNALSADYKKQQAEINAEIITYLQGMGHTKDEIVDIMADLNKYTNGLAENKVALDDKTDSINKSADAAERARKSMSKLTYQQEEQALKNQYAKKSFKELNSDIQETIKLCSKKLHLDIKVNYDDSELPSWIKKMSKSQLKASIAARRQFLDTHTKGSVLKIGGQVETYEQAANKLAMLQARGNNIENAPKKSQKELDKEKKAREKAAAAAEKARNKAETQAGNRRKATEDYANTISSYSEKASESIQKGKISQIQDNYEKELAEIRANDEKEKKAIEDGIDKLVEARKKRDQTLWVNSGDNRKANMWKAEKSDEEYRKEVMGEGMKDSKGNEIKDESGKAMTIAEGVKKQIDDVDKKTLESTLNLRRKQLQSMYDYLEQYGTFQQQKLAITQSYAQKIAEATKKGDSFEVMRLRKEESGKLDKIDADSLLNRVDLSKVFSSYGVLLKAPLEKTIQELEEYTTKDSFKSRSFEEQKAIYEAIDKAKSENKMFGSVNIKELGYNIADYNNALVEQASAERELADATYAYIEAEKKLQEAKLSGKDTDIKQAQAEYDATLAEMSAAQTRNDAAKAKVVMEQSKTNSELSKLQGNFEKLKSSISSLRNGSLASLWNLFGSKLQNKIGMFVSGASSMNKQLSSLAENLSKQGVSLSDFSNQIARGISELSSEIGSDGELAEGIKDVVSNVFSDAFGDKEAFKGVQKEVGKLIGDLFNDADTSKDIGKTVGNIIDKLAQGGQASGNIWGMIIGLILELLDEFADNALSVLVDDLLTRIGDAINGLLSKLFSDLLPAIVKGLGNLLDGVLDGVMNLGTFGLWGDINWNGNNAKEVADTEKELVDSNERLKSSIESLKSEMEKQSGAKAIKTANEIMDMQKQMIDNARQQIINQNNYHDAHHSNASYWDDGYFTKTDGGNWASINKTLKEFLEANPNATVDRNTANSYQDLLQLTPEQMAYLRAHNEDQWQAILNVGKYDASDEKWNAYADLAGSLQETVDALNESLTKVSFSSLEDEFVSTLMDMNSSALDFSNKFSEYLMKAVLSAQISNQMKDEMNEFYKEWGKRAKENGGVLGQTDISYLSNWWNNLVDKGMAIRDQVADVTGYKSSYSQQASSGTFESMSQDTGEELNGRFTAVQIATEGTYQQAQEINGKLDQIVALQSPREDSLLTADLSLMSQNVGQIYVAVDEGRTILAQSLMCLQSIDERQESWHKPMLQAFDKINRIAEKVERI